MKKENGLLFVSSVLCLLSAGYFVAYDRYLKILDSMTYQIHYGWIQLWLARPVFYMSVLVLVILIAKKSLRGELKLPYRVLAILGIGLPVVHFVLWLCIIKTWLSPGQVLTYWIFFPLENLWLIVFPAAMLALSLTKPEKRSESVADRQQE